MKELAEANTHLSSKIDDYEELQEKFHNSEKEVVDLKTEIIALKKKEKTYEEAITKANLKLLDMDSENSKLENRVRKLEKDR